MKLRKRLIYIACSVGLPPVILMAVSLLLFSYYNINIGIEYLVLLTVLIMAVTTVFFLKSFSRLFLKPLDKLNEAMNKVAEGNLDFSIRTKDEDDLSQLCNNFDDMRARLKESSEEKIKYDNENRELISNISHDLKTPITSIKGYVEGIMDGVADTPDKMDRYIKTIYNKTNEMDSLINELTLYSRIDTNRIPYNFHRINIGDFFNDCVEEIGLDLESKNITLTYNNEVDADTRIIADPEQLRRVISNIIGNSVKYMGKPSGNISISISDHNDSVQIDIEDNGRGIAAKDLPYIFDRFYRTDTSRNSAQGGSGIGLSVVKKIIEDHGGYIWATGQEGVGTTMHFVLRKYQEANTDE
ncbi:MAG: HAMP domain-containing histidine kinase [Lachnospiraceae bacterium]|nr:HAMP domain-containing histidine kinase [Lachnospiraceae bacterium]